MLIKEAGNRAPEKAQILKEIFKKVNKLNKG